MNPDCTNTDDSYWKNLFYTALLELLQGTELIDSIQELRSAVEERKIPRDVLSELLSSFMQGGGFSDN